MLEARNLSKRYRNGTLALKELDLKVEAGEILCLLGANGAGKTTAIRLFLNFIEPTGGTCLIDGVDVPSSPLEAKRRVAYLPESVMLYGSFTARQNLDFFARLGGRRDLNSEDYDPIMEMVGLPAESFDQRVKAFSKGMRQKLGIAIAISRSAANFVLDEPMSGLDPKAAADLVWTLSSLRDEGKAILLATHDIFRARRLADRVVIMRDGIKVMERTREELEAQDLEKLYLSYMDEGIKGHPASPSS